MAPLAFSEHLKGLFNEYDRLEGENSRLEQENQSLKSLLHEPPLSNEAVGSIKEEQPYQESSAQMKSPVGPVQLPILFSVSPHDSEGTARECDLSDSEHDGSRDGTQASALCIDGERYRQGINRIEPEAATEVVLPSRAFQPEATHGVALGGLMEVVPTQVVVSPPPENEPTGNSDCGPAYSAPAKSVSMFSDATSRLSTSSKRSSGLSRNHSTRSSDREGTSALRISSDELQPHKSGRSLLSFSSGSGETEQSSRRASNASRLSNGSVGSEISALSEFCTSSTNNAGRMFMGGKRKPKVFQSLDDMKAKVREQLLEETYDVMDLYHANGCCAYVAKHPVFENLTQLVIAMNAIWIGVDTDYNKASLLVESDTIFQVAEHFFCIYFVTELLIRFVAFSDKRDCTRDMWFVFDASLVVLMVLETWIWNFVVLKFLATDAGASSGAGNTSVLRMARLLRLTRMARMARLLRAMPELVILLKGISAAARSVFFTLVLLLGLLYVFAIAFTQLLENSEVGKVHFSDVVNSMHTLWLYAALLDEITHLMVAVEKTGTGNVLLLDVFILMAALTVMNMLVGVLCEVVSAVAKTEKEELEITTMKSKVEHIFYELGLDGDRNGMISKAEFVQIIENKEAARAIQDLGVDVVQMVDMADVIFAADDDYDADAIKELSFSDFMDAVIQLRGSNFATVKDLVNVRNFLSRQISKSGRDITELRRKTIVPQKGGSSMFGMTADNARIAAGLHLLGAIEKDQNNGGDSRYSSEGGDAVQGGAEFARSMRRASSVNFGAMSRKASAQSMAPSVVGAAGDQVTKFNANDVEISDDISC